MNIPSEKEFTGLSVWGAPSGCVIKELHAVARDAVCSLTLNLSQIDGASQFVMTDMTTKVFIATHMYCGTSIEYQVTYSPSSTTENLISLPTATVASIAFA